MSKLKFYDGTKFRTTGGAEVSATQPSGLTEGDFGGIMQTTSCTQIQAQALY